MPVRDGLEMAREVRAVDRKIPIILLTAFEQIDYLKNSINIGVDKYVTKPVDGLHLQQTLLECARRLRLEDDLHSAARTDPLTGLANRRELMNRFRAESARIERYGGVFSLLLADIDHFKQVNVERRRFSWTLIWGRVPVSKEIDNDDKQQERNSYGTTGRRAAVECCPQT
jgi:PleD family two-component response regulator